MINWEQIKDKIKNPPADRLASIEYKSHFMQMLGTLMVCIILVARGYWYVIFAFIFALGISYSQGITAYQKYKMIISMKDPESLASIGEEKSPTRRRDKVIKSVFGNKGLWICSVISALAPSLFIPKIHFIFYTLAYVLSIIFIYALIYYFLCYWIAYPFYKRKLKGGVNNGKTEKNN